MCKHCKNITEKIWLKLEKGGQFRTPDLYKGENFYIEDKNSQKIKIAPQNIFITKESFFATLHYLFQNEHYSKNQCEIHSSNSRKEAGPLCIASRNKNLNVRCINYILPILQKYQVVDIYPGRPNKTWII